MLLFIYAVRANQLTMVPPSQFNGISTDRIGCTGVQPLTCGGTSVLVDGVRIQRPIDITSTEDVQEFFTWSRTSNPAIVFGLGEAVEQYASLDLYFLNYPAEGIGLPNLQLIEASTAFDFTSGTAIPYTFSNNNDLSTDDTRGRRLTLQILSESMYNRIRLEIDFTGVDDIDWFFLSEAVFCRGVPSTTPPTIVFNSPMPVIVEHGLDSPSSVRLTCSLSSSGLFEWRWPDVPDSDSRFEITTTDWTRTSTVNISAPSPTDAGNYTCEVRHQMGTSGFVSRSVELVLPGKLI